jgi:hypothetical protein
VRHVRRGEACLDEPCVKVRPVLHVHYLHHMQVDSTIFPHRKYGINNIL